MRNGADRRREAPRGLRIAALGLGVFGIGVLAAVVWSGLNAGRTAPGARNDRRFSSFIDDLPIMPGLVEGDDGYVFGLTDGTRLAEARLGGDADPAVVCGFYAAMLDQLGWRASSTAPYTWRRRGERLVLEVGPARRRGQRNGRGLEALFVIAPDPEAAGG